MATGDVTSRIAELEYRVTQLENLLAPQFADLAAAQAKAAAAGVAAQVKAEADQAAADKKVEEDAVAAMAAAESEAARLYLSKLLAAAQAGPAGTPLKAS